MQGLPEIHGRIPEQGSMRGNNPKLITKLMQGISNPVVVVGKASSIRDLTA